MVEENKMNLEEECQRIIENAPLELSDDKKMRYICHELALILAKNVEFFYDKENEERRKEIFNSYQTIENNQVICRNAAYLHVDLAKKLDLDCKMIEIGPEDNQKFNHWAIEFNGENNKRYIINPIPDFYRIQLGFSTKSFCSVSEYFNYNGEAFDTMSEEYLRKIDEELGYLSGGMYTDELLEKLRSEINARLGTHIIKTTDTYQEYYSKLLELMKNENLSIEEKLEKMKPFDPEFEKHKESLKDCIENKRINRDVRKIMHNLSVRHLISSSSNLERNREGSKYLGEFNITNMENFKKEILLYKFNYMMECLPQLTKSLTGFIENKNFIDELKKYIFKKGGEREAFHRHTVTRLENGKKEYYMMLSLKLDEESENKVYCFYNQKTKECVRSMEPLEFMLENSLIPIKDSSLNDELERRTSLSAMMCEGSDVELMNLEEKSANIKK